MAKRHDDALTIAAGACNPSGIANAIFEACRELRAEPDFSGTKQMCHDPAIRLMVHQLAYIMGVHNGIDEFTDKPEYSDCTKACREGSDTVQTPARDYMVDEPDGSPDQPKTYTGRTSVP